MNTKKKWVWIIGLLSIIALSLSMTQPFLSNTKNELYVEGKKVNALPQMSKGQIYVPLSFVAEGMGDSYSVDKTGNIGTVKQGKKNIVFKLNNLNVTVDGKKEYLHVKKTKWATAPTGFKVKKYGKELYVPIETLEQVLDYEFETKKSKSNFTVYVGESDVVENPTKPTKPITDTEENPFVPNKWKQSPTGQYLPTMSKYPLPEGIKPYKATAKSFTNDTANNLSIMKNQLGFSNVDTDSALYEPYGSNTSMLIYKDPKGYYVLQIYAWKAGGNEQIMNLTPYMMQEISRLFFGEAKGKEFWNILDKGFSGDKSANDSINKVLTINNRSVLIEPFENMTSIRISDTGVKFDKNYNIIK